MLYRCHACKLVEEDMLTCPNCGEITRADNEEIKPCPNCDSGLPRKELRDAKGYSCGYVCDKCEEEKKSHYRPEIFEDPNYEEHENYCL